MSDHKTTAGRFFEDILTTGDWSSADEVLDPELVMHHPSVPEPVRGRNNVKQALDAFRNAFPDLQLVVEDLVEEGDKVAVRWTARGTHRHDLFGIAPTGRAVMIGGVSFLRFSGGKIAEDWVQEDTFGMLQQLGAIPSSN